MDENMKGIIIQLQAQISALGSILMAHNLITEESLSELTSKVYIVTEKELRDKL
ncbi:hypothetical protein ACFQZE_06970 [Paenibacillus sp. GCM10027627]|uniref:hypothetical protein n=1 Tax=unclassified Paenibacillus TaxID=185978 RepID=UPI00362E50E8